MFSAFTDPAGRPSSFAPWIAGDRGSMTVFSLFAFLIMLFVAGIAVDMMRVEHERVRMQGASDRAVLAATMLRGTPNFVTPEVVVDSFLAAEGLEGHLQGRISVTETGQTRSVTVTTSARIPSMFMRLLGVDNVDLATPAGATESLQRTDFDIALVLDVSGSMDWDGRIENMRAAAYALAEDLLTQGAPGQFALSFVPYSTEVRLPPEVMNQFTDLAPASNLQTYDYDSYGNMVWHTDNGCIDFGDWPSVASMMTNSVARPWMRRYCYGWSNTSYVTPPVRPMLTSLPEIRAYLDSMGPVAGTSIDLGVRAGGLFLDPSLRPAIADMIEGGQVPSVFANRPFDADRPNTVRAMVLMTDGENCCYYEGDPASRFDFYEAHDLATTEACAGLKATGVVIYAVAFEAPQRGIDVMSACASSPNHFFNASSDAVIDAFRAIGTHIQNQSLRLTQ
jgi:hypothetical protein